MKDIPWVDEGPPIPLDDAITMLGFTREEIEVPGTILVCLPVDTKSILNFMDKKNMPRELLPKPYVDAVRNKCGRCLCEVWVGPMQQRELEVISTTPIVCFLCVFKDPELRILAGFATVALNPEDGPRRNT